MNQILKIVLFSAVSLIAGGLTGWFIHQPEPISYEAITAAARKGILIPKCPPCPVCPPQIDFAKIKGNKGNFSFNLAQTYYVVKDRDTVVYNSPVDAKNSATEQAKKKKRK